MITNNYNDERDLDITELPTDEYPVLSESAMLLAEDGEESDDADQTRTTPEPVRAAFSLAQLEAEVTRLHAKWQSIDSELKSREARIAELQTQVEARETTIAKLTADVERKAAALEAADERLTGKDAEIAALVGEQRVRDERIDVLSKKLADAESQHEDTRQKVARAEAETARLDDLVRREQAAAASITQSNQRLLAEHTLLQTRLQDLEIYINGRHDRWSELNAQLAAYKDSLRGMEQTLKARDAIIARQDEEKRQLTASIHDLERQCSELAGGRKERESAYDELQEKLASQLAQAEQLRTEHATRTEETEQAIKRALDSQQHIESLERGLEERDAKIAALNAEVEQSKLAVGAITAAKTDLDTRVDALEKALAEREQQTQALRDDLQLSHEQLRLAQEQSSDRAAQLASRQAALDDKARHAEQLADELDAAQKESARLRADFDALGAHASELGRLRGEALAEAERLEIELAARQATVAKLETDLRAKQVTADLLERSVDRITGLGASLATLAADDKPPAAAPSARDSGSAELLSMGRPLGTAPDGNIVELGERSETKAGRKLVITIDGRSFDYPIVKKQMTIGRGQGSDIRISSHFVSRVHARIRTTSAGTIVEDAGSKNGLLVNSERVLRRLLRDGDIVTLGDDVNLRFVDAMH